VRPFVTFRNVLFYCGELLAPAQPQTGGPPLVGCPQLLIKYIRSYPLLHHSWKLYLKYLYPSNEVCKPSAVLKSFFLIRFLEFVHYMYTIWMKF
jgi:hypothetical protein